MSGNTITVTWPRLTVALLLVLVACAGEPPATAGSPSATTATTAPPGTTTPPSSSTQPSTTTTITTTTLPLVTIDGWTELGVDSSIFAGSTITDGASDGQRVVIGGCESSRNLRSAVSLWWSDDATKWTPVAESENTPCIRQVEHTSMGWFAAGYGGLRSVDGIAWETLDLSDYFGLEYQGQLGWVQAVFVSPDDDRVTLLFSRAAEAESTIATLVTTTDGETWSEGPVESAALFDSSTISDVTEGGEGLIAVGASPGGEFVPTAAVFTSPDGLTWRRVTPRTSDFDDKVMSAVTAIPGGFVAVGGDFFRSGLMTAWTSADGIAWTLAPHPDETTDPSVAYMMAEAVTVAPDGIIWAAGLDFDARRDTQQGRPALWRSEDGRAWQRVTLDDTTPIIPFTVVDATELRLGVWPPPFSVVDGPRRLFEGS